MSKTMVQRSIHLIQDFAERLDRLFWLNEIFLTFSPESLLESKGEIPQHFTLYTLQSEIQQLMEIYQDICEYQPDSPQEIADIIFGYSTQSATVQG